MVHVTIVGTTPPCAKCKRAEREAQKAAAEYPDQVKVRKIDALSPEAEAYGMVVTPTVVVDEDVVGLGRIVPAAQLIEHIGKIIGG